PGEVDRGHNGGPIKKTDGTPVAVGRIEKMSKSRKNVVGLEEVSENYGIDAARLLILSDSPPERDVEWTEGGIEGAWKYLNRLWRLVTQADFSNSLNKFPVTERSTEMKRKIHGTIHDMTQDLERFHFNKAVARLRELSNALEDFSTAKGDGAVLKEGCEALVKLMAPMMPHIAEELWQHLGHKEMIVDTAWPEADKAYLANDTATIAIQVNGKLRATITLPRDAAQHDAEKAALDEPAVQKAMEGKAPKKVIVVPNRIINVVV
ncbi:MAG: leucine--tRNA ligase, partial [Alphaproteobacteria bacterium]